MNYQSLYQETSAYFNSTVEARAKVWVNAAYQEFLTRRKWSFLETTSAAIPLVASQQSYVLLGTSPVVTDFNGMISVELELTASGARVPLREMDPQTYVTCTAHSRVNGAPAFWSIVGGTAQASASAVLSGGTQALSLWPIPINTAGNGVNIFCRYDRSAAGIEMSATTDVPILPAQYHYALIDGAIAIGYKTFNQDSQAEAARRTFMLRMEEAAREDESMRMRDLQRVQLVQQAWLSPQVGRPRVGDPADSDSYPAKHS
jgi:hypothetical protein